MKIQLHPDADADLDRVFAWIAKDNPITAYKMIERIENRIAPLATSGLEHMGRVGLVKGTRELIEHPYIIVYEIHPERDEVVVLAIFHGVQGR